MKTVGEILKKARESKGITLPQLAAFTKIHERYLEAIEADEFAKLPPAAFTKGFLQTYADIVDVNKQTVLAVFRRDFDQDERGRIIPRSMLNPVKPAARGITPHLLTFGSVLVVVILIVTYFLWQFLQFSAAPQLSLTEPVENAVLISPINVRGVTDPLVSLQLNNRTLMVDPSGNFSSQIQLTPGQHTLVLIATGRNGKKSTMERIIYIENAPLLP